MRFYCRSLNYTMKPRSFSSFSFYLVLIEDGVIVTLGDIKAICIMLVNRGADKWNSSLPVSISLTPFVSERLTVSGAFIVIPICQGQLTRSHVRGQLTPTCPHALLKCIEPARKDFAFLFHLIDTFIMLFSSYADSKALQTYMIESLV